MSYDASINSTWRLHIYCFESFARNTVYLLPEIYYVYYSIALVVKWDSACIIILTNLVKFLFKYGVLKKKISTFL